MIVNILFLGFIATVFAQGENNDILNTLKVRVEESNKKVQQVLENLNEVSKVYDEYLEERKAPLLWECTAQQEIFNQSITRAVSKGVSKNKKFTNYQCIATGVNATIVKLNEFKSQIVIETENIRSSMIKDVEPFRLIASGFRAYIKDLHKTTEEEIKKATKEEVKKKILGEFLNLMNRVDVILKETNEFVVGSKFKLIEKYSVYAFGTDKKIKETQRIGSETIMKCVA